MTIYGLDHAERRYSLFEKCVKITSSFCNFLMMSRNLKNFGGIFEETQSEVKSQQIEF